MSADQTEAGQLPEHAFTITHYIRPGNDYAGWSQVTSGEMSAGQAHDWLQARQEHAEQLGLRDAQPVTTAPGASPAGEGSQLTIDQAQETAESGDAHESASL